MAGTNTLTGTKGTNSTTYQILTTTCFWPFCSLSPHSPLTSSFQHQIQPESWIMNIIFISLISHLTCGSTLLTAKWAAMKDGKRERIQIVVGVQANIKCTRNAHTTHTHTHTKRDSGEITHNRRAQWNAWKTNLSRLKYTKTTKQWKRNSVHLFCLLCDTASQHRSDDNDVDCISVRQQMKQRQRTHYIHNTADRRLYQSCLISEYEKSSVVYLPLLLPLFYCHQ